MDKREIIKTKADKTWIQIKSQNRVRSATQSSDKGGKWKDLTDLNRAASQENPESFRKGRLSSLNLQYVELKAA